MQNTTLSPHLPCVLAWPLVHRPHQLCLHGLERVILGSERVTEAFKLSVEEVIGAGGGPLLFHLLLLG